MCKRAYNLTIALKNALTCSQTAVLHYKLKSVCQSNFFPLLMNRFQPSPYEVMNGLLMRHGYGANQFLVTRLVAVTQKARRVGVCVRGVKGRPGTHRELHLHYRASYIFNIYCFLLIEQEETVGSKNTSCVVQSFHPPTLSMDQSFVHYHPVVTAANPLHTLMTTVLTRKHEGFLLKTVVPVHLQVLVSFF